MSKSKKIKKIPLQKSTRSLFLAAGVILLGTSLAGIKNLCDPGSNTTEQTRYSYEVTADSSYRVFLKENPLFQEQWLEEGKVYAQSLTDSIEVTMKAALQGSGPARITGAYEVFGMIEGYQTSGESKKRVYDKQFPLLQGEGIQKDSNQAFMEAVCSIDPETWLEYTRMAEQALGTSTAKDFYINFSGWFAIETEYGNDKKEFSYQISIPLGNGAGLYEIQKPDKAVLEGSLKETTVEKNSLNPGFIVLSALTGTGGIMLLIICIFLVRLPSLEEIRRGRLKAILRKYGSRMVELKVVFKENMDNCTELKDLESLMVMAEEVRRPVFYCLDQEGLPERGLFWAVEEETVYLYQFSDTPR